MKTVSPQSINAPKATVAIIGIAFAFELVVFSLWYGYGVPRDPVAAALVNAAVLAALLAFPVYWVLLMRFAVEDRLPASP